MYHVPPLPVVVALRNPMTTNETTNKAGGDAFWNIAFMQSDDVSGSAEAAHSFLCNKESDDSDDENDDNKDIMRSRSNNVISYRLPIMSESFWCHDDDDDDGDDDKEASKTTRNALTLHLSPLPSSEGIVSLLGAQAWYGSALLSALLLQQIPYKMKLPPRHPQQQDGGGDQHGKNTTGRRRRLHLNCENNIITGRRIQKHLAPFDKSSKSIITALELGSGAVGLGGLSLACMLACMSSSDDSSSSSSRREQQQQQQQHRVILTDYEPCIVQQLKRNVNANVARLQQQFDGTVPDIQVARLDWNALAAKGSRHPLISLLENRRENINGYTDEDGDKGVHRNDVAVGTNNKTILVDQARQQQQQQRTRPMDHSGDDHTEDALQLVVGSELVYTTETAHACAQCVRFLLERYPRLLVVIVQVIHRDGWSNVFLPTLLRDDQSKKNDNIVIEEECIPVDCDTIARGMIPAGGTLDRFDFGACYIYRSEATTTALGVSLSSYP
jgi:Lysine methyltransferase